MLRWLLQAVSVVLSTSLLMLTGCLGGQQPARFYLLNTPPNAEAPSLGALPTANLAIGLGPLTLPKYLDRPQIVTRLSPYELTVAEFERWAEPLEANFSRTLAEDLSRQIPTERITLFPWPRTASIDYQVTVDVTEFYAEAEGQSSLVALWSIFTRDGTEALVTRKSRYEAPAGSQDYAAIVAAMSQTVTDLGRDIASALRALATKTAVR